MTPLAPIIDLAAAREAREHPCAYCGRPCPVNDRLPRVSIAINGVGVRMTMEQPAWAEGKSPMQVHAACAISRELGRGFALVPT